MQKRPVDIQTFSEIRKADYLSIDKTQIALDLIENNKYVFLSRPRCFGKSLFLDTLKNIFQANKSYFDGLFIYHQYDWTASYPSDPYVLYRRCISQQSGVRSAKY